MTGQIVAGVFHSNYGNFPHQNLAAVHSRKHCAKVTFSVYPVPDPVHCYSPHMSSHMHSHKHLNSSFLAVNVLYIFFSLEHVSILIPTQQK